MFPLIWIQKSLAIKSYCGFSAFSGKENNTRLRCLESDSLLVEHDLLVSIDSRGTDKRGWKKVKNGSERWARAERLFSHRRFLSGKLHSSFSRLRVMAYFASSQKCGKVDTEDWWGVGGGLGRRWSNQMWGWGGQPGEGHEVIHYPQWQYPLVENRECSTDSKNLRPLSVLSLAQHENSLTTNLASVFLMTQRCACVLLVQFGQGRGWILIKTWPSYRNDDAHSIRVIKTILYQGNVTRFKGTVLGIFACSCWNQRQKIDASLMSPW